MKKLLLFWLVPTLCFGLEYEAGGEALLWKPCNNQFHYGEYAASGIEDQQLLLSPTYIWGFRLYGNISSPCLGHFVDGEWAYIDGETNVSALNNKEGFILTSFPYVQTQDGAVADVIYSSQNTRYNKVSGKLGHRFCENDCAYLFAYIGGRWQRICVTQEFHIETQKIDKITAVMSCTDFCGGGVEGGVGAYVNAWCGLGGSLRLGAIGVMGRREHVFVQFLDNEFTRRNNFHNDTCTGAFEIRAAVNYVYECAWFSIKAEIAYELDYYLDILLREQPSVQSPSIIWSNFGIGGPSAGISISF